MGKEQKASYLYIITGVLIALVAISFARLSYGIVLPLMKDGLSISYKSAGFLGTITSFGYLITIIFSGVLSTKWGGKNTILFGLLLIIVGFFNLSITHSYWSSSFFMFVLGIGTAFVFTPLVAILIEWFPHQRGLVIGWVNSSAGIGLLFVGILVPFLNEIYPVTSWRLTWKIFCICSILVFFVTIFIIKNPPLKDTVIYQSSPTKKIYTNRKVIVVGLIYGIVGLTFIVQSIFMMSFMLEAGLNQQFAGHLIAISGVLSIFSSPIWGGVSDRLGRRNALILAIGLNFLSTIIPVLFPNTIGFSVNQVIQGAVATGIFTLVQALSTEQVSPQDTPIAFSYVTFYFAVGQFIGPTLAGWIIDYGGFKSTFFLSAICMFIGFYLTIKISAGSKIDNPISTKGV
ncbi:MFS transporter [Neobacillus mesonae]|uniref:Major facilitator superfamily (MFS) profile domain-containing protein n=1 Tax=Neobacillus mesonae TaxID=1193713 RepID=A0A3Q9QVQ7_9BACI|nr:MFS transporter [Neobacillus mesonae]AZU62554.1 hypothetical protein CHR53_15450 [Neobacillus mesonae]